jgi:hypothetical protein
MQHKQCDEMSRVNAQIKKQGRDYLPESFDLNLYQQPVWKPISKDKWRTKNGFDNFSGATGAHVGHSAPGQGKTESHRNSINGSKAWKEEVNVNSPGAEPYASGYAELTKKLFERKRDAEREIGDGIFISTCRPSVPMDDKISINSLH